MFTNPSVSSGRILIVDDERDSFDLLRHLLQRVGATEPVDWFGNGEEALEHLQTLVADQQPLPMLVVLDLKMPRVDGFAVLREIRATPQLARLLIVVVSTSSRPEDIARALQLGAFCYFEKYPLPDKFAPVYQLAKRRVPVASGATAPDDFELSVRRIIGLVEDALAVFHLPGAVHAGEDRQLMDLLGSVRRSATAKLLNHVNKSDALNPRWPFHASLTSRAGGGAL